jgi:hypothetical protein
MGAAFMVFDPQWVTEMKWTLAGKTPLAQAAAGRCGKSLGDFSNAIGVPDAVSRPTFS